MTDLPKTAPDRYADYADVIVIGGGVAGCAAALSAARKGVSVVMLTKLPDPEEANTRYAQGGIIYTGPEDSPGLLARDILDAGDPRAARLLAEEGPRLVRRLLIEELSVPFDTDEGRVAGEPGAPSRSYQDLLRLIVAVV